MENIQENIDVSNRGYAFEISGVDTSLVHSKAPITLDATHFEAITEDVEIETQPEPIVNAMGSPVSTATQTHVVSIENMTTPGSISPLSNP